MIKEVKDNLGMEDLPGDSLKMMAYASLLKKHYPGRFKKFDDDPKLKALSKAFSELLIKGKSAFKEEE